MIGQGIDTTGQRVSAASCRSDEACEMHLESPSGSCERLPTFVLPMYRGEEPFFAHAAERHRRGKGFDWPPEARFMFATDPTNGISRYPVPAAWIRLLMKDSGDRNFQWRPDGKHALVLAPEDALTGEAAASISPTNDQAAVVVPDGITEEVSQRLLDSFRRKHLDCWLIRKSVALALEWCRLHEPQFQGLSAPESSDGTPVGILKVVEGGFTDLSVSYIRIHARRFQTRVWLVPVYDPNLPSLSLPGIGARIRLADAVRRSGPHNLDAIWRCFLRGSEGGIDDPLGIEEESKLIEVSKILFGVAVPPVAEFVSEYEEFNASAADDLGPQLALLGHLGVAYSCPPDMRPIFGEIAPNDVMMDANASSRGAARFSLCLAEKWPTYREILVPVSIYVQERDELGDASFHWADLVEGVTVDAGSIYRHELRGFRIDRDESALDFFVKRPLQAGLEDTDIRKAAAELDEPAQEETDVTLQVAVEPGQGFARIDVTSKIFSARVNWDSMQPATEDDLPELLFGYIPDAVVVFPDSLMFHEAEEAMREAIDAFESSSPRWRDYAKSLRENRMNVWINQENYPHRFDSFPGPIITDDVEVPDEEFRYYSVVGSNGASANPDLVQRLANAIEVLFLDLRTRGEDPEKLWWLAGWLYTGLPLPMKEFLVGILEEGDPYRPPQWGTTWSDGA